MKGPQEMFLGYFIDFCMLQIHLHVEGDGFILGIIEEYIKGQKKTEMKQMT